MSSCKLRQGPNTINVGQRVYLPRPVDPWNLSLAAQLPFCPNLQTDTRNLIGENTELRYHLVDSLLQLEHLSLNVNVHDFRQITHSDGLGHFGYRAHLVRQVGSHLVDVQRQIRPGAFNAFDLCLSTQNALRADFQSNPCDLASKRVEVVHHGIDGRFQLVHFALDLDFDFPSQVSFGDRGGDGSNGAHLIRQR